MKKMMMLTCTVTLLMSLIIGCGKINTTPGAGASATPKTDVTIKIYQFKVEIAEALNAMALDYERETGVKVLVETHGGGEDYSALLKAELASGSEPEIYNNGGYSGLEPYMDRAVDLSGEPWVKDLVPAAKEPTTVNGKLYGMPMNIEGYGLIYNKDLFAKAGITVAPKTLPQLTDAVNKLKAAGITPFEATNEWWSLGIHLANVGLAYQPNPAQFINDLKAGKASFKDNAIFKDWLNLVDVIFNNAQKEKLTTDYAAQVANFAAGKAAIMQQGNWTQGDIDKVNPKLNLAVLPISINANEGHVLVGVPNNWIVNSKSPHPQEAKAFLNWMVSSDTGKSYITKQFKFMPALTTITAAPEDIGQIAFSIKEQSDKALGWHWDRFPDGVTKGFGADMQEYMFGKLSKDQLLVKLDKSVQDIVKK